MIAAIALFLGAAAHFSASGSLPDPAVALFAGVTLTALSAAVLSRQAGVARLAVLIVGGQLLVHTLLSIVGGHSAHSMAGGSMWSPSMLAAHAAAALVVAAWLVRGERMVWSLTSVLAFTSIGTAIRIDARTTSMVQSLTSLSAAMGRSFSFSSPRQELLGSMTPVRRGPPAFAA